MSKQETRNFSIPLQKSDEKSEKYRNAGNTMFSKSKLKESIRLYTEVNDLFTFSILTQS